jgi:hypothetical protein
LLARSERLFFSASGHQMSFETKLKCQ